MERNKTECNGWVIIETPESSRISKVAYHQSTKLLQIQFIDKNNNIYNYKNVPKEKFEELISSESVGKAFQTLIYKEYPYYKISGYIKNEGYYKNNE